MSDATKPGQLSQEQLAFRAGLLTQQEGQAVIGRAIMNMHLGRGQAACEEIDTDIAQGGPHSKDLSQARDILRQRNEKSMKLLGASPKASVDMESPQSRLFLAAVDDDAQAADRAVVDGARVDATNLAGVTALGIAASSGHRAAFEKLLALGAKKLWDKDDPARPALTRAAEQGNAEAVKLLLAAGVDPNTQTPSGDSALRWAIFGRKKACAQILRDAGAVEPAAKAAKKPKMR